MGRSRAHWAAMVAGCVQVLGVLRLKPSHTIGEDAGMDSPSYATVLANGDVCVSDSSNNQVKVLTSGGATLHTLGCNVATTDCTDEPEDAAMFLHPTGLASDGNVLYVAEWSHRVQKLRLPGGEQLAVAGRKGHGERDLMFPEGLVLAGGKLFVADSNNHRVVMYSKSLRWYSAFGSRGQKQGQFEHPSGMATNGVDVFVADRNNDRIQVFTTRGEFKRILGGKGRQPGRFDDPWGLAVTMDRLFVSEGSGGRVQMLTLQGRPLQSIDSQYLQLPHVNGGRVAGLCVDEEAQSLYVVDERLGYVVVLELWSSAESQATRVEL